MQDLSPLRHLWSHHKVLFLTFCVALVTGIFFAARLALFTIYWSDPAHRFQPLEGWMTPGYIARSYQLDPEIVQDILAIGTDNPKAMTLSKLAKSRGLSQDAFINDLQTQLDAYKGPNRD